MLSRDDVIRMAREAGFEVGRDAGGEYVAPQYSDSVGTLVRFAALVAEQSRMVCQLEAIALREELTRRAMQAERDAYRRGVRDEREAGAKLFDQFAELMRSGKAGDQLTDQLLDLQAKTGDDLAATIRARAEKGGA